MGGVAELRMAQRKAVRFINASLCAKLVIKTVILLLIIDIASAGSCGDRQWKSHPGLEIQSYSSLS